MRALERENKEIAAQKLREAREECFRNIAARKKEREVKQILINPQPRKP